MSTKHAGGRMHNAFCRRVLAASTPERHCSELQPAGHPALAAGVGAGARALAGAGLWAQVCAWHGLMGVPCMTSVDSSQKDGAWSCRLVCMPACVAEAGCSSMRPSRCHHGRGRCGAQNSDKQGSCQSVPVDAQSCTWGNLT